MCVIGAKVGQGHPDDCVCNDWVKPINLPSMNSTRKFLCLPKEITILEAEKWKRKVGQGASILFAKVKVAYAIYPLTPLRAIRLCTITSL